MEINKLKTQPQKRWKRLFTISARLGLLAILSLAIMNAGQIYRIYARWQLGNLIYSAGRYQLTEWTETSLPKNMFVHKPGNAILNVIYEIQHHNLVELFTEDELEQMLAVTLSTGFYDGMKEYVKENHPDDDLSQALPPYRVIINFIEGGDQYQIAQIKMCPTTLISNRALSCQPFYFIYDNDGLIQELDSSEGFMHLSWRGDGWVVQLGWSSFASHPTIFDYRWAWLHYDELREEWLLSSNASINGRDYDKTHDSIWLNNASDSDGFVVINHLLVQDMPALYSTWSFRDNITYQLSESCVIDTTIHSIREETTTQYRYDVYSDFQLVDSNLVSYEVFDNDILLDDWHTICDPQLLIDKDRDGILDETDNCPYVINPTQYDEDDDGEGYDCDMDNICTFLPDEPLCQF